MNIIYSLTLRISLHDNIIIPKNNLNSIYNKVYSIKKLELEYFNNFPTELIFKCYNLQKLKIIFRAKENLAFLELLVSLDTFTNLEKLEKFCIIVSEVGKISSEEINEKKKEAGKNTSFLTEYLKHPKDESKLSAFIKENYKKAKYLKMSLTKNVVNLSLVFIISDNELKRIYYTLDNKEFSISNHTKKLLTSIKEYQHSKSCFEDTLSTNDITIYQSLALALSEITRYENSLFSNCYKIN